MNDSGYMHNYYDWAAFEKFVKELYESDGDAVVQRDVSEVDRYGAKRQIDIKITRKTKLSKHTTLVECKRWKEPVGRDRIDVLAASIEALGANGGALFTTTGFEEGAIAYAKGKGIELYVVRDLTPEEWGRPGRHIAITLHICSAIIGQMHFSANAIILIEGEPDERGISINLKPDNVLDPDFDIFSIKTGERGSSFVALLGDAHALVLSELDKAVGIIDAGGEALLEIKAHCVLDFSTTEYRQLRLPQVAAKLDRVGFEVTARIHQAPINVDRGNGLDFALMLESYVSEQRLIASRGASETLVSIDDAVADESGPSDDTLKNGSLITVRLSPWTGLGPEAPTKHAAVQRPIMLSVRNEGGRVRPVLLEN